MKRHSAGATFRGRRARRLLVSSMLAASIALLAAAPAPAEPDIIQPLPDAACQVGTQTGTNQAHAAQAQAGRPFNPHVPHYMGNPAFCMTMPGTGPPG